MGKEIENKKIAPTVKILKQLQAGDISINQARKMFGFEPIKELGDYCRLVRCRLGGKGKKERNFFDTIEQYTDLDRRETLEAKRAKGIKVNINPDCYIAKEIKHQTALIYTMKQEMRELKKLVRDRAVARPEKSDTRYCEDRRL